MSVNYQFLFERVRSHRRILDFGCGFGGLLDVAAAAGDIDRFSGADTFETIYENWLEQTPAAYRDRVSKIENGRLPYEANSFDCVVSNMVFEHIDDLDQPLEEIARVLEPGGKLICLFPVWETAYEGHVGLFFPHYLLGARSVLRAYLKLCFWLKLGLYREGNTAAQWAEGMIETMDKHCVYHRKRAVVEQIEAKLSGKAVFFETEVVDFRVQRSSLPTRLKRFLRDFLPSGMKIMIYRTRGSLAFEVERG